jgi:hypothetical protein
VLKLAMIVTISRVLRKRKSSGKDCAHTLQRYIQRSSAVDTPPQRRGQSIPLFADTAGFLLAPFGFILGLLFPHYLESS